jgi:hypothetical protein
VLPLIAAYYAEVAGLTYKIQASVYGFQVPNEVVDDQYCCISATTLITGSQLLKSRVVFVQLAHIFH